MRSRRSLGSWVVAAALLAAPLAGCGLHGKPAVERKATPAPHAAKTPAPGAPRAGAVDAATPAEVVAPGLVEPWDGQTELAPQEPGWIARIAVAEGERVEAGQLLAALEDGGQRHALDLARAELAEAEAALARLERGATAEELRQVEAERAGADARARLARADAARTRRLHEQQVIADADADRVEAEARAQGAAAERAEARFAELRRGARPEDRAAARARVAAARARVGVAEASLARRRVLAPAAGTILLSRFHAGELYGAGAAPLFLLGRLDRLRLRLEVDEIDAGAVEVGARCDVYSDAGERLGEGVVRRLAPRMGRRGLAIESPTARADVRVREVFVELPAGSGLVPGQRVWGHAPRALEARGEVVRAGATAG